MPKKSAVHVVPNDEQWAVRREGSVRAGSLHATKADAVVQGTATAQREKVELLIHNKNGQIAERNSVGHDPFPPRG